MWLALALSRALFLPARLAVPKDKPGPPLNSPQVARARPPAQ